MSEWTRNEDTMEARITAALERPPLVTVPADFAARVRASLPAKPVRTRLRLGRIVALGGTIVLTMALFVVAPHAAPSGVLGVASFGFDMELLLLAELGGVAWWLCVRQEMES
jgi:hypothetical protein